jgi:peptidoglycan/xylan/chitin deacetylase (PgdA/CDA1 family)
MRFLKKMNERRTSRNILGLKIDVDTYVGMKKGVPRLLSILDTVGLQGTFYLSFGPDSSGRAVFQLLKNPLFLKKMMRTNAGRLYGFQTALYGTLLPSPKIALSFPDIVDDIIAAGHEVEFHAWDHRRWQDELLSQSYQWIEAWFEKGITAYRQIVGREPLSFGAPAWLVDNRVLEIIRRYEFTYLSCSRARNPFVCSISGLTEIPSNLPCFEETGVDRGVRTILNILNEEGGVHVLPVHAEAEGGIWDIYFMELLKGIQRLDYEFLTLSHIKDYLHSQGPLPKRAYRMKLIPGRSAPCAV